MILSWIECLHKSSNIFIILGLIRSKIRYLINNSIIHLIIRVIVLFGFVFWRITMQFVIVVNCVSIIPTMCTNRSFILLIFTIILTSTRLICIMFNRKCYKIISTNKTINISLILLLRNKGKHLINRGNWIHK